MALMYPYLKGYSTRQDPDGTAFIHRSAGSTGLLRPLVPGCAFLDVEGGHHIGSRFDGPGHIRFCGRKEGGDDDPVLNLSRIGQDAAVLVKDQLAGIGGHVGLPLEGHGHD